MEVAFAFRGSVSTCSWDLSDPSVSLNLPLSTNWVPTLPTLLPKAYYAHRSKGYTLHDFQTCVFSWFPVLVTTAPFLHSSLHAQEPHCP